MKILMVCEDFRIGGAQVFALRLAKALSAGHEVWLYSHYSSYINWKLIQRIAPEVKILYAYFKFDWFIRKFDRLLYKLNIDFSWREKLIAKHVKKVIKQYEIQLIHSHMFKSDYVVAKALHGSNIPIVVTMHGNYESFLERYSNQTGEIILNYPQKLRVTLDNISAIAYLTDKNLRILDEAPSSKQLHHRIVKKKIYNGFSGKVDRPHTREEIEASPNDLVFGMVARGISAKGWKVAIEAFNQLASNHIHLVLVGWSDYVASLAYEYSNSKRIHFVGHSDNPLNWVQLFDVGLLPSTYGESLPNVIVEYLYFGKPTIVSDVGESRLMIEAEGQSAGFLLPIENNRIDPILLSDCMNQYVQKQMLLVEHGQLATLAFQKFDMNKCVVSYTKLYDSVYAERFSVSFSYNARVQLRSVY